MSVKITSSLCSILCIFLFGQAHTTHAWIDGTPYLLEKFANELTTYPTHHAPLKIEIPNVGQVANLSEVGDQKDFTAVDFKQNEQYVISATLRSIGDLCYIFVDDQEWQSRVTPLDVEKLRRAFERSTPTDLSRGIYQIETELIGRPPDIDNDPHIYILLLDIPDSYNGGTGDFIAGYFNPVNQQRGVLHDSTTGARLESNEIEMVYLDTNPLELWFPESHGILAHEFQHLIHWEYDSNEDIWVNEGCSEYAMFLCGYVSDEHVRDYERTPNIPLAYWPRGMMSNLASYGAAYLWMLYLHEHYGGENTIRSIIRNKANGIAGINSGLFYALGEHISFDTVFTDWKIANYLDDPEFEDGRYGYKEVDLSINLSRKHRVYPIYQDYSSQGAWASDYISFGNPTGSGNLIISFQNESSYRFDLKLVQLSHNTPIAIKELELAKTGVASAYVRDFGKIIDQVVMIPSIQPVSEIAGVLSARYSYTARIGEKVSFVTNILPNPVHPRYWDIAAVSNEEIGTPAPLVTVIASNTVIARLEKMLKLEDGNIYTYQIYLPANQSPEEVNWEIYYFEEKVGEGKLGE